MCVCKKQKEVSKCFGVGLASCCYCITRPQQQQQHVIKSGKLVGYLDYNQDRDGVEGVGLWRSSHE